MALTSEQASEKTALYQLLHALQKEARDGAVPASSQDRAKKHERLVRLRLEELKNIEGGET